jgi:hypothetical protein
MSIDWEQIEQEDRLWPWLADGSMGDETCDPSFDDLYGDPEPYYFCDSCDCGLSDDEAEGDKCPECGAVFDNENPLVTNGG